MNSKRQLSGIKNLVSSKIAIEIIIDFRNVPFWSSKVSMARVWDWHKPYTHISHIAPELMGLVQLVHLLGPILTPRYLLLSQFIQALVPVLLTFVAARISTG